MQINSVNNTNSFGRLYVLPETREYVDTLVGTDLSKAATSIIDKFERSTPQDLDVALNIYEGPNGGAMVSASLLTNNRVIALLPTIDEIDANEQKNATTFMWHALGLPELRPDNLTLGVNLINGTYQSIIAIIAEKIAEKNAEKNAEQNKN